MNESLRQAIAVCAKDLRSELRSLDSLLIMSVFGLLIIVIFNFAFEPSSETRAAVAPGVLWTALIFAGLLGLDRSFQQEKEDGCLSALLTAPLDRGALFLGKWAANLAVTLATEIVILPAFVVFFNLPVGGWLVTLLGVIALGSAGFCAAGTVLATVAGQTAAKHLLLPILLLPLLVPLLIAAVEATALLVAAAAGPAAPAAIGLGGWLRLLTAFSVIYVVAGWLLFGSVVEG